MAEAIVSTVLGQLRVMAIDKATEAWELVKGVEEEVSQLERNFKALQYELEDAEEKQYQDKRLKHWLDRFKEVSCDMEDVLDDWKTAVQEMQAADHAAETSTTSVPMWMACPLWKVFVSCFSFGSEVVKRHDIAARIKDINKELDQIVKNKNAFNLTKREIIEQPNRTESSAFVDVSKLHGRDEVKEDIIRTLLCGTSEEEGSCIPTISIVGMGGLGKTALAQLIYNDHRIQTHFHKTIWVCVSDSFDPSKIARAILEALGLASTISLTTPLQTLLSKIRENITEKKFFLVLDDVWIDRGQEWEQLKATFQSHMSGSRILVTTRKESVAKHMESSHVFPLNKLSDEICWRILSQKAFIGRNKISSENLEDIGKAIAMKCDGLPLAAITLGGLLQDKLLREEWQNVLNSEIWKSDFAQEYIFAPLLLSYFDLPSAIRRCLSYCAIFPKDFEIGKYELVQHWMALGYLNSNDNLGAELRGENYFKCLATRSFFQDFDKDDNGDIIGCKMHDLVHDFVLFLTQYGFVTKEIVEDLRLDLSSQKARYLTLVFKNFGSSPVSIYGAEKLRSLVALWDRYNLTTGALPNLFSQSNHLRLLEFDSFYPVVKEFPYDVGKLNHLRYLGFVYCFGLRILPEAVCELPNLQSLNLRYCSSLEKLPIGFGKLINLRYLCIKKCPRLTCYPKGISNITSLVRLGEIKTRVDGNNHADEFSIGDLENLNLLENLCVELTGNAIDWDEAKRAKLHNKIHLKRMDIWICSPDIKKEEVVPALNPPSNLHVALFDYRPWVRKRGFSRTIGLVQKATVQLMAKASGSGKNNTDEEQ